MFNALKQFIFLEDAQERYIAIKNYTQIANSWQVNLLTWQILSLLPTNKEKATLAQSLKLTDEPGSEWAIFSYLLEEEHDDEVIQESVLNLANTKNHFLGDKIRALFDSKRNNPDILTTIFSYVTKTGDTRFKDILNRGEIFSYSVGIEQFLNASLKLGVINQKTKEYCLEIISNTNTKESLLYSALFYFFFSANKNDYIKSKTEVKNYRISKAFNLCLSILKPIYEGKKEYFFETAMFQTEPLFLGYGFFTQNELNELTQQFIEKNYKNFPIEVTKTILSLHNKDCTQILSEHIQLGIHAIEKNKNEDLINLWVNFCPIDNTHFVNSVREPSNYNIWHNKKFSNFGFILLDYNTLHNRQNPLCFLWQDFFEENLNTDFNVSMNILFFQILALRNSTVSRELELRIISNVKLCLKIVPMRDDFVNKIYALCISSNSSPHFIKEIYNLIPFSCTSWAFIAIALTAPKLDIQTLNYAILRELHSIREALMNENLDKNEYILEVTSRFQSIIIGADKFHVQVTQPTLSALKDIANLIQSILDSVEEGNIENEDEESLESLTNWTGKQITDKPILRWNAILQVCLNSFLSQEELKFYEKVLCDGLKSAPHVEKRWVVRALVRLDSNDAIKAILYQTLNHIDNDFIERTVYELFSSKHPRAKQALIRTVTKNTISDKTKIAIIEHMKKSPSQDILEELKDLMQVRMSDKVERCVQDAVMEISQKFEKVREDDSKDHKFTSQEIDFVIKTFIRDVHLLSIDSRSALRTAEMIFIQSKDWGKEGVDLSPIVNMYCKSVELVLRDTFEPFTDAIMRNGELSKKLDHLGYGKMVQEKMQNFEDFIADLPIIKTIPYFSKFKLRKMLRAICLYRPGKRFTLDGPKAFALFLLVTARQSCPYSLEKLFQLHLSDLELFTFIKQVHALQDSRNRAVHEGLTWEAREEIDNLRKESYCIIDVCLKIGLKLNRLGKISETRV